MDAQNVPFLMSDGLTLFSKRMLKYIYHDEFIVTTNKIDSNHIIYMPTTIGFTYLST